jgi:hypothetical protein
MEVEGMTIKSKIQRNYSRNSSTMSFIEILTELLVIGFKHILFIERQK